jgi:hypothetical protein
VPHLRQRLGRLDAETVQIQILLILKLNILEL